LSVTDVFSAFRHESDGTIFVLAVLFYIPCESAYENSFRGLGVLDENVRGYLRYLRWPKERFIDAVIISFGAIGIQVVRLHGPVQERTRGVVDEESGVKEVKGQGPSV